MACTIEIEVARDAGPDGYRVASRSSTGGEASGWLRLDVPDLLRRRRELQATLLASAVPARAVLPELEVAVREIGEHLFAALVHGNVYGRYVAALATAQQRGEPLRVVLRLRAPELAALPWEMLFDRETGGYLCQSEPLIRHVQVPAATPPVITPPLRVLGLVAAPRDLPRLDAGDEKARLAQALDGLGGRVRLRWAPTARWNDLQELLLDGPWHVIHFIGHGGFDQASGEGTVALEQEDGRASWVGADRFARLLSIQNPAPRLVVLNSCSSGQAAAADLFSSTAATLVRTGVSAAVAMQFAISDPAAKAFAAGFYQAIATNRSISEAVRVGRIGIAGTGPGTLEWATPVLYLRGDDAQDTALFTVVRAADGPTATFTTADMTPSEQAPPMPERSARRRLVMAAVAVALAVLGAVGWWSWGPGTGGSSAESDIASCAPPVGQGWNPIALSKNPTGKTKAPNGFLIFTVKNAYWRAQGNDWEVTLATTMENATTEDLYHENWRYNALIVGQQEFTATCYAPNPRLVSPRTVSDALIGFTVRCTPVGYLELVLDGDRISVTDDTLKPGPC